MTALYLIAADFRQAADKLAELDLDAQTIADTLESISGDLEVKAQNVAFVIRNLESTAAAIKEFEEQQRARRKAMENRADSLRDYLARCMEMTGIDRIERPGVALSFRKSSAVVINEPGLIPAEFMTKPEPPAPAPDKTKIAAAIKAGQEVAGAHIEQRRTLQIK